MYDALGYRIIGAFGSIYLWCFGVVEDRVCSKRLRGSEKLVCLDNIRQEAILGSIKAKGSLHGRTLFVRSDWKVTRFGYSILWYCMYDHSIMRYQDDFLIEISY